MYLPDYSILRPASADEAGAEAGEQRPGEDISKGVVRRWDRRQRSGSPVAGFAYTCREYGLLVSPPMARNYRSR
jgi:hypothetical protein